MQYYYEAIVALLEIWIEPTEDNYLKMQKAFYHFGLPINAIEKNDFLGTEMDVFSFGVEPQAIDIMTAVKGLTFEETFLSATEQNYEKSSIRIIHIKCLIVAKMASGRYKDLNDIEHLKKLL